MMELGGPRLALVWWWRLEGHYYNGYFFGTVRARTWRGARARVRKALWNDPIRPVRFADVNLLVWRRS